MKHQQTCHRLCNVAIIIITWFLKKSFNSFVIVFVHECKHSNLIQGLIKSHGFLMRGVGYFLHELHVLVGADPSETTTVWVEEESRLLFSFASLLVCVLLGLSDLGVCCQSVREITSSNHSTLSPSEKNGVTSKATCCKSACK